MKIFGFFAIAASIVFMASSATAKNISADEIKSYGKQVELKDTKSSGQTYNLLKFLADEKGKAEKKNEVYPFSMVIIYDAAGKTPVQKAEMVLRGSSNLPNTDFFSLTGEKEVNKDNYLKVLQSIFKTTPEEITAWQRKGIDNTPLTKEEIQNEYADYIDKFKYYLRDVRSGDYPLIGKQFDDFCWYFNKMIAGMPYQNKPLLVSAWKLSHRISTYLNRSDTEFGQAAKQSDEITLSSDLADYLLLMGYEGKIDYVLIGEFSYKIPQLSDKKSISFAQSILKDAEIYTASDKFLAKLPNLYSQNKEIAQIRAERAQIKAESEQIKAESEQIKAESEQIKAESDQIKRSADILNEFTRDGQVIMDLNDEYKASSKSRKEEIRYQVRAIINKLTHLANEYSDLVKKRPEITRNYKNMIGLLDVFNERYNDMN